VTSPRVVHESPFEFFKAQVEAACEHQRLHPSPTAEYYVVSLLTAYATRTATDPVPPDEPLALKLARALNDAGHAQRTGLRQVGDLSLFMSGFFSDALRRTLVDVDYYISLGGYAYGSLSELDDPLRDAFGELSEEFPAFVDVVGEVSERCRLTSNSDLLRLYERWGQTGSRRLGDLLIERGLLPNPAARGGKVQ
jgi:hypothetical protein